MLFLSPLLLFSVILVKVGSRGPVFYRQLRVGQYGRDFWIYKFRTMVVGADRSGLLTTGQRDARLTPTGHFLRRYKLDELPQLINVIKGEMSLVGPRPEVRRYVDLYTSHQCAVLDVRPGMTDMASIKYADESCLLQEQSDPEAYYTEVIMPDKIRINLETISLSQSVWGSLRIIGLTLGRLGGRKPAKDSVT